MQAAQRSFISSTYWTERIGPTAAIATIKKHRKVDAGKHLVWLGEQIQSGWERLTKKHGLFINIGGMKPMSHFAFNHELSQEMKAYFIQLMLEQGFLTSNMFYAMYAHSENHVEKYLKAADRAFAEIAQSLTRGDIKENLKGQPSSTGFHRLS